MKPQHQKIPGTLVTLVLPGQKKQTLDGFWTTGTRRSRNMLIFVHGMGSNFYKSRLKKTWMRLGPRHGWDVLCFNNRGCEGNVASEKFRDCIADIDAALDFAHAQGYRNIVLLGHSTGCQKIIYHQHRRKSPFVKGLILAALGDDLAIARRDLGADYGRWLKKARNLVTQGKGDTRLPPKCLGFTAKRFLSAVDPAEMEAGLFHLEGPLRIFRKVKIPILTVFPQNEQYACIPVEEAAKRLARTTQSTAYKTVIIPDADHSFHGQEEPCVRACIAWLKITAVL